MDLGPRGGAWSLMQFVPPPPRPLSLGPAPGRAAGPALGAPAPVQLERRAAAPAAIKAEFPAPRAPATRFAQGLAEFLSAPPRARAAPPALDGAWGRRPNEPRAAERKYELVAPRRPPGRPPGVGALTPWRLEMEARKAAKDAAVQARKDERETMRRARDEARAVVERARASARGEGGDAGPERPAAAPAAVDDAPRARGIRSAVRREFAASATIEPGDVPLGGRWRVWCALSMALLQAIQAVLRRWQGAGVVARFDFAAARVWIATEESFCTTMVLCATGVRLGVDGAFPGAGAGVFDVALRRSLFHDATAAAAAQLLLVIEDGPDSLLAHLHIPVGGSRVCSTVRAHEPQAPPRFPFDVALLDERGAPQRADSGVWLCMSVDPVRWATARGALPASSTTAVFTVTVVDLARRLVRIDVRTSGDDRRAVELECAALAQPGAYEMHPFPTSTIKLLSESVRPLRLCLGPPLYRAEGPYARARAALIAQATPYLGPGDESLELVHITHNADIFGEPEAPAARSDAGKRARDDDSAMAARGERLMRRIASHRRRGGRPDDKDSDSE